MIAAEIPDLDGLGLIVSDEYFYRYHHVYGHNIFFGIFVAAFLSQFSTRPVKVGFILFGLFLLHLLLDSFGSGIGWGLTLFWPVSPHEYYNPYVWKFGSWQNILAFFIFVIWTAIIAKKYKRTPLESWWPKEVKES